VFGNVLELDHRLSWMRACHGMAEQFGHLQRFVRNR
jgi:hypothetical protein